jgi:hypothetical protein
VVGVRKSKSFSVTRRQNSEHHRLPNHQNLKSHGGGFLTAGHLSTTARGSVSQRRENAPPVWTVVTNIFNKELRTVDKGSSPGRGLAGDSQLLTVKLNSYNASGWKWILRRKNGRA